METMILSNNDNPTAVAMPRFVAVNAPASQEPLSGRRILQETAASWQPAPGMKVAVMSGQPISLDEGSWQRRKFRMARESLAAREMLTARSVYGKPPGPSLSPLTTSCS